MTNDFNLSDALKDMMLHQLHPDADLDEETVLCAKCGSAISFILNMVIHLYRRCRCGYCGF